MSAITSPALALTRAFDRFGEASARVAAAAQNSDESELTTALVDQSAAATQAKAAMSTVRFADEMWKALLDMAKEPGRPR